MQTGRLQKIGIARETTKGTGVVPAYWLSVDEWDLNPIVNVKQKEGAFARIEDSYGSEIVQKHNEPSIGGIITDKAIGTLFYGALGSCSSSSKGGDDADVYDHTFSVLNSNLHPSFTLSMEDVYIEKWVPYCLLDSLEIKCAIEDYARFSASFVGKYETDETLTPSYTEENVFVPRHIEVKVADSIALLDSANAIDLKSINLTISKNVEAIFGLGSDEPSSIHNKDLAITGTIERLNDSATWRGYFGNNTAKALRITLEDTDTTIGATQNPKIVITISRVKFNPYKLEGSVSELVKESIDFKGYYSTDESSSISVVLTNEATSY